MNFVCLRTEYCVLDTVVGMVADTDELPRLNITDSRNVVCVGQRWAVEDGV